MTGLIRGARMRQVQFRNLPPHTDLVVGFDDLVVGGDTQLNPGPQFWALAGYHGGALPAGAVLKRISILASSNGNANQIDIGLYDASNDLRGAPLLWRKKYTLGNTGSLLNYELHEFNEHVNFRAHEGKDLVIAYLPIDWGIASGARFTTDSGLISDSWVATNFFAAEELPANYPTGSIDETQKPVNIFATFAIPD